MNIQLNEELLKLSSREIQVIELVAAGRSGKQVASDLGISRRTVANHVASIMEKIAATSQAHAVAKCFRAGIIA